jgi:hypothetical protein
MEISAHAPKGYSRGAKLGLDHIFDQNSITLMCSPFAPSAPFASCGFKFRKDRNWDSISNHQECLSENLPGEVNTARYRSLFAPAISAETYAIDYKSVKPNLFVKF